MHLFQDGRNILRHLRLSVLIYYILWWHEHLDFIPVHILYNRVFVFISGDFRKTNVLTNSSIKPIFIRHVMLAILKNKRILWTEKTCRLSIWLLMVCINISKNNITGCKRGTYIQDDLLIFKWSKYLLYRNNFFGGNC